ncbi:MAG: hypothetical protein QXI58_02575 [Candidatus Micrarchaeia archaeon]
MTKTELFEFARKKLGDPIVKVELENEHLEEAYKETMRWFNANKGIMKVGKIEAIKGINEYELPPDVKGIYSVYVPERGLGGILGGLADIMKDFGWAPGLVPIPRGRLPAFAGVVLFLQKMEMVYRIAGREATWEFKNGKLYLYPVEGSPFVGTIYYDYKADAEIEDLTSPMDIDLVCRYFLACCKEILGKIRGKYSTYPMAEGTVELDASELLESARVEKEKLNEEMLQKTTVPFLVG